MKNMSALNEMQYKAHKLLSSYINGGFSKIGFALYPICKPMSGEFRGMLGNVVGKLDNVRAEFGLESEYNKKSRTRVEAVGSTASVVSTVAQIMGEMAERALEQNQVVIKKPGCNAFALKDYDKKFYAYLKPVARLQAFAEKKLRPYLKGFYVHGSIATRDFVPGWSDLDTFAIVRQEAATNPKSLGRLASLMYKARIYQHCIDPLQHHGHHLIAESDLEYYPQVFMPVETLKYAKSLLKDDEDMEFRTRDCENESRLVFDEFSAGLLETAKMIEKKKRLSNYHLKFLLHKIALYPSLYLGAKGTYRYKRFSFTLARPDFSTQAWNAVTVVSSARKQWKNINDRKLITGMFGYNPVLAYQINAKISNMRDKLERKNRIDLAKLASSVNALVEEAKKNARQRV